LIARGHEYVERNDWAQKKQEYTDLIDSLSTERFNGVHPAILAPAFRRNGNTCDASGRTTSQVKSLSLDEDDSSRASLLEKN
jgi:hypothetical protein